MSGISFDRKELESLLWQEWFESRSIDIKHKLVEFYYDWCFDVARDLCLASDSGMEIMDAFHFGTLGLIESIDKYDSTKGDFTYFARLRVRGTISTQIKKLTAQKEPEATAIATSSGEENPVINLVEFVNQLFVEELMTDYSIDLHQDGHHSKSNQSLFGYDSVRTNEIKESIDSAMKSLSHDEANIVRYYYFHHMSISEIADILEISKGRVSQLHQKALSTLKRKLGFFSLL